MKRFFLFLTAPILLSACMTAPEMAGPDRYAQNETMRAMPAAQCTVVAARVVDINAIPSNARGGRTGNALSGPNAQAGAAVGALVGALAGQAVSNDRLVQGLFALGGGIAGTTAGERRDRAQGHGRGVEYEVQLTEHYRRHWQHNNNRRVIVQPLGNNGVMSRGTPCTLVGSGNSVRVLPQSR